MTGSEPSDNKRHRSRRPASWNRLDAESRRLLECLQDAVAEALERKRRLGQYAVVWRDGRPAFIGPNPPTLPTQSPASDGVGEDGDLDVGCSGLDLAATIRKPLIC